MSDLVDKAVKLFQSHRNELGFVNSAQVREKRLLTKLDDGNVVAALLANHCVRKPQTTLYDIAVMDEHRRNGYATDLVDDLVSESPHNIIVAKCPKELPATNFYESTGWEHVSTESGKNRELNVYHYRVDND